ncbi:MAG: hypothetical protein IPJ03_07640 [Ignavibacteriales bacterium]|nr:hypothetical protein [Ignavibacteriales bacterium]
MSSFKKIVIRASLFLFCSLVSFAQSNTQIFLEGAAVNGIERFGDELWISTYGQGIYKYSYKNLVWENYSTKNNNLENDLFYCIAVSKEFVWAGSAEGLFIFNKKKNKWTKKKFSQGGEFGNWIRALEFDNDKNLLWIGRFRNISFYDVKKQTYTDIDRTQGTDLKSNTIKAIALDGDSLIWFGSESGIHKYYKKKSAPDPKSWYYLTNKGRYFNGEGKSVSVSDFLFEGGNIWFATDEFVTKEDPEFNLGGLFKFNRKLDWKKYYKGNGLAGNGIYCIERSGNYIWAGVYSFDKNQRKEYGKGITIINRLNGKIETIELNELNITSSVVHAMYFDGNAIWLGTDDGLAKINLRNPLADWTLKKEIKKKKSK